MMHYITDVQDLPQTSSPYSFGVVAEGKFLFISGQLPYDPVSRKIVRGSVAEQTKLVLECLRRVILKAGGRVEDIVNCRVYLQQLTESNFAEMNAVYGEFFGENKPTRTTIGCQLLNVDVEIDCMVKLS